MMDKQEWTPKPQDYVWYLMILEDFEYRIEEIKIWKNDIRSNYFSSVDYCYIYPEDLYPTHEAAKADLIKKLEAALEGAKRL